MLWQRRVDLMIKYPPGSSRVRTNNTDRNYEEDVWCKMVKIMTLTLSLACTRGPFLPCCTKMCTLFCPPLPRTDTSNLCCLQANLRHHVKIQSTPAIWGWTCHDCWTGNSCMHAGRKKATLSLASESNAVPVVLPRIHLGVFHSVLLGEEHEGIHWPFAFCRCGTASCPWGVPPVWFTWWRLWRAGALKFVTVWTYGAPTRQGGSALAGHAAQNVHGWGI